MRRDKIVTKYPTVSVVIPSWNARHFVGECLDSLRSQTYRDFEVIVVENGSKDGSPEFITNNFPEVILLKQESNTGFAKGVNIGIQYSKAKYVALLNNDAIADKGWLSGLVLHMESHPNTVAAVSKILKQTTDKKSQKPHIDTTGDQYSVWGMPFPRGRGEVDSGQYEKEEPVFAACGGAVIYRRDTLIQEVGIFDEAFFAYYEDIDISCRIRRMGYDVYYVPSSVVYHRVGATSGGNRNPFTRYHSIKNAWFLYLKEMPGKYFWVFLPRFFIGQVLMLVSSVSGGVFFAHIKSSLVAILYTPTMVSRRWRISRSARVSDATMVGLMYKGLPPIQVETLKKFGITKGKIK